MFAGDKFSYEDHKYARFIAQQSIDFVRATGPTGNTLVLSPWLRYIFPESTGFKLIRETNIKIVDKIKVSIN